MIGSRAHLFLLIPLFLALVWIAAVGTNADSIWYDEYLSFYYSGALNDGPSTIPGTIDRVLHRSKGQVPFYYIVLSVWGNIAGWSVFTARVLSLSFGLLAVAWTYRLGADLHSSRAGFYAALLLAGSAFFIYYLHEIRGYSLLVLELLIVLALYLRILRGRKSRLLQGGFVCVTVAMLHSHAFMAPIVLAFGLYHCIAFPKTDAWKRVIYLTLVSGLLYIPWAVFIFAHVVGRSIPHDPAFFRTNVNLIISLFSALSNGLWVFLLLPVYSIRAARKDRLFRMLWVLAICYLTVMLGLNQITHSLSQVRYFAPLLPLFAVLGGITCSSWVRYKGVLYGSLVVWCISGFLQSSSFGITHYMESEYRVFHLDYPFKQISEVVRRSAGKSDAVAFEFPHHSWALRGVIDYYMDGSDARYVLTDLLGNDEEPAEKRRLFGDFLGGAGRVYFVSDRTMGPSEFMAGYQRALSERYIYCGSLWDDEWAAIDQYAQITALCAPSAKPLVVFEDGLELLDFVHEISDQGHVFFSVWSSPLPADTYSFSLRVWDAAGNLVHQADREMPTGDFIYSIDEIPVSTLPHGQAARVEGVIYQWRTGDRLRTANGADVFALGVVVGD